MKEARARDVAVFMLRHLSRNGGILYQRSIAFEIREQYGDDFVYINDDGHLGIARSVLSEFRKLTEDEVVWSRRQRLWRFRRDRDNPTSRMSTH